MSKVNLEILRALVRNLRRPIKHALLGARHVDNVKVIAYELARQRMAREAGAPLSSALPERYDLQSIVCSARDWQSAWLPYWAMRFGMKPALHRKLWEFAYIAQVLHERGSLAGGSKGIGFGCGKEPLPSVFAASGCQVLATDLPASDSRSREWSGSEQHGGSLQDFWVPGLCSEDVAKDRIAYRAVDMNQIPPETYGKYDFCWSSCALEHLGSIANGLKFIVESTRCLKVGGVAVHTTELSLDAGRRLDNFPTAIFDFSDFVKLGTLLHEVGVELSPIVVRPAEPFLDEYIDVPPYPNPASVGETLSVLHLRLLVASFPTTSVGLVARRVREAA